MTEFIRKLRIVLGDIFAPRGAYRDHDFNNLHGRWRVKYPDGKYSAPFCRDVAEDYAKMFDGKVVRRSEYKS